MLFKNNQYQLNFTQLLLQNRNPTFHTEKNKSNLLTILPSISPLNHSNASIILISRLISVIADFPPRPSFSSENRDVLEQLEKQIPML